MYVLPVELLKIVVLLGIVQFLDWALGVVLAYRAGTFDIRKLPDTLKDWTTYLFGLFIIALAAGVQGTIAEVNISTYIVGAFWVAVGTYVLKLVADFKDKISALGTATAARAYFDR